MNSYNPMDIRAYERLQAEEAARAKREKDVEDADVRWLMSRRAGRRIVWRLLERAGVFRISYQPGMDALTAVFNEGKRNEGNYLLGRINELCPDLYVLMTKEYIDGWNERNTDGDCPGSG
jgi:hypothetical protein